MRVHTVQKGDTLWKIARKYGISFEDLKRLNAHLANPDYIVPGMEIFLPAAPLKDQPRVPKEQPRQNNEHYLDHHKEYPVKERAKEHPVKERPIKEVPRSQPIPFPIPLPIPMPQPIPQLMPQPVPQFIPKPIPQLQPQPVPQPQPQPVPQPIPHTHPHEYNRPVKQQIQFVEQHEEEFIIQPIREQFPTQPCPPQQQGPQWIPMPMPYPFPIQQAPIQWQPIQQAPIQWIPQPQPQPQPQQQPQPHTPPAGWQLPESTRECEESSSSSKESDDCGCQQSNPLEGQWQQWQEPESQQESNWSPWGVAPVQHVPQYWGPQWSYPQHFLPPVPIHMPPCGCGCQGTPQPRPYNDFY